MKKVMYLLAALMFFSFTLNATSDVKKESKLDAKTVVKIEKVKGAEFFNTYIGVCLDGTRFTFEADSREEAQAYVNGYCRGLRDADADQ